MKRIKFTKTNIEKIPHPENGKREDKYFKFILILNKCNILFFYFFLLRATIFFLQKTNSRELTI